MLAVIENGATFITDNDEHGDATVFNSPVGHTNVLPLDSLRQSYGSK